MPMTDASHAKLATCHLDLVSVVLAVAETEDITVIVGHRGQADQDAAFKAKKSKLRWPNSRHNSMPSTAVDLAPGIKRIDWRDIASFVRLADVVHARAAELGIELEWGGDWRMRDYVHWQLSGAPPQAIGG